MLKTLDVLIGLTVIMLVLSMGVTMLTQFVTTLLNSRGRHLKRGVVDLLHQIDPALKQKAGATAESIAGRIADAVLTHPLISASGRRLGTVVHREELTRLLLYLVDDSATLEQAAKTELKQVLARNGITDPAATLKKIRDVSMQLEAADPSLAVNVRQTLAILQEARSDFVAKINNTFDQAIDRVSSRFTASTRAITFVAAILVAAALQVDTISLVNRLSADDKLREAFVARAASVQSAAAGIPAPAADAGGANEAPQPAPVRTGEGVDLQYMAFMADNGLLTTARTRAQWIDRWGQINIVGVLITSLLLSLGAPFWYNMLGRLLQLRSVLAAKDDDQRNARQSTKQVPANAGSS
jgi:hypothetical protein